MQRTAPTMVMLLAALAFASVGCGTDAGGTGGTGGGDGGSGGTLTDGGGGTDGGGTATDGGGTATDGGAPDAGATDAGWGPNDGGTFPVVACQGHVYQCGDGIDNDGDGKIDWQDPDCLGPCDNNESGYATAIPGGNSAPCKQDCYFDQDTGSGNDTCAWNAKCDPLSPQGNTCPYDANLLGGKDCPAAQTQTCHDFCGPLTPNGCDCFGCCDLPGGSGNWVYIGSTDAAGVATCDLAHASDPALCHPCTPVAACQKTCGRCQLCLGKTTVPPDCYTDGGTPGDGGTVDGGTSDGGAGDGGIIDNGGDGGTTDGGVINPGQCPSGVQACGLPGQAPCTGGYYCITGCCQPTIP